MTDLEQILADFARKLERPSLSTPQRCAAYMFRQLVGGTESERTAVADVAGAYKYASGCTTAEALQFVREVRPDLFGPRLDEEK